MTQGSTQFLKLGVIGDPVSQSPSPDMFNAALQELGILGIYHHYHVTTSELEEFVLKLRHHEIDGINITIPHKQAIIPFLDTLTHEAQKIGAVNTVYRSNGQLIGHNTDGDGFWMSLQKHLSSNLSHEHVWLLGAGGASMAIGYTLLNKGLNHLTVCNRSLENSKELVTKWQTQFPKAAIQTHDWNDFLLKGDTQATLLINTTSLGLKSQNPWPKLNFLQHLPKTQTVCDIVANPIATELLQNAENLGFKTVAGWEMLLNQAVLAFHKFTNQNAPQACMQTALLRALGSHI